MNTDFEYLSTRHFDREHARALLRPTEPPAVDPPPMPEPRSLELDTADAFDEHGRAEAARGRYVAARAMHERAMELRRAFYGEADPLLPRSFTLLGNLSLLEANYDEAEWLYRQAHESAVKRCGPAHPAVAMVLHNLGVLARRRGQLAAATALYREALAIKEEHLGDAHPSVAATLANLGNLCRLEGDAKTAMHYYGRAREIYESTEGCVSAGLASTLVGMGRVHLDLGVNEGAIFVLDRALRIREALHVSPEQLAGCRYLLAAALASTRPEEARLLLAVALREYEVSPAARPDCVAAMRQRLAQLESARVLH